MATDIAFAVGVLALLGNRVAPALRVLLLALAIVDDIGAIIVIAIFYSTGVSFAGMALAAAGIVTSKAQRRRRAKPRLRRLHELDCERAGCARIDYDTGSLSSDAHARGIGIVGSAHRLEQDRDHARHGRFDQRQALGAEGCGHRQ
jgi:hypothetical protein